MVDSVENYLALHHLPKVDYNIETKTNPLTDNIYHPAPPEFVAELMKLIKSKGIEKRVIISLLISEHCRSFTKIILE
jgi:glycerophosphoryl diester phosphodiesterase